MNTGYIVRRLAWRWLPALIDIKLSLQHVPLRRGMETLNPQKAVDRYLGGLNEIDFSIQGKRVFILGYGGNFAAGCKLLEAGAHHVTLYDPYREPDHAGNQKLLGEFGKYLAYENGQVKPRSEYITLHEGEIAQLVNDMSFTPYDLLLSASVFEHVEDVEGMVEALSRLTDPAGLGLHFIDLRDHLYSYPFEMLCYSHSVWKSWLNPLSYLNRYRSFDFQRIFSKYYSQVAVAIEKSDAQAYQQVAQRVKPEFRSGNLLEDSATYIKVMTWFPRSKMYVVQLPEKSVTHPAVKEIP